MQQNLQKLEAADTQGPGVSMDSAFANEAFADQIGVTFPPLSDWGSPLAPGNFAGDIPPLASWIASAFTAIAPVDHRSERSGTPMRPDGSTPYAGLADLVRIVCSTFGRNSTCFSP